MSPKHSSEVTGREDKRIWQQRCCFSWVIIRCSFSAGLCARGNASLQPSTVQAGLAPAWVKWEVRSQNHRLGSARGGTLSGQEGRWGHFLRLVLSVLGHRPFPHLGWGIWFPVRIPATLRLSPGALWGGGRLPCNKQRESLFLILVVLFLRH